MTVEERLKELIDQAFSNFDTLDNWSVFTSKYKQLEFTDELTDDMRIAEFKWIGEQFRKYVNTRESTIRQNYDPYRIREQLYKYLEDAKVEYTERKRVAYASIRNDWLRNLLVGVHLIIDEYEGDEEDGRYGE